MNYSFNPKNLSKLPIPTRELTLMHLNKPQPIYFVHRHTAKSNIKSFYSPFIFISSDTANASVPFCLQVHFEAILGLRHSPKFKGIEIKNLGFVKTTEQMLELLCLSLSRELFAHCDENQFEAKIL